MTPRPCPICGQPCGDDTAVICRADTNHLRTWLTELPELHHQLALGTAHTTNSGRTLGAAPPAPLSGICIDTRTAIHETITAWAAWASDVLGAPPAPDLPTRCHQLAKNAHKAAHHDEARDLHAEIRALHQLARQAIDTPAPRPTIGECTSTIENGQPCPGHLTLDGNTLRCDWCGVEWGQDQWPQLGDLVGATDDGWITIKTAAHILGVSRNRAVEIVNEAGVPSITSPDATHARHYPAHNIRQLADSRARAV